jgi:hypothetical protein
MKFFKFVCYAAGFTVLPVVAQANWVARANQATGQLDAQVVSESGLNKLAPGGPGSPVKFGTAIDYPSGGSEADSVALGDLNGDGILDVVVANFCLSESDCSEGTVSVLIGNGKGGFQAAVSYGSGGVMASSVAIADVNGDGKLDLVVANYCQSSSTCNYLFGPGSVSVLLGNGDGTFQAAVSYGSGGCNADSVAVADVNGDGHPDLVVANYSVNPTCGAYGPGEVSVLLGNGDGTFQPAVSYLSGGYSYSKVAVGDFNSDGHLDLVVTNGCINEGNCNNGVVNVLLGNRDGTFQSPVTYSSGGDYAKSVAIADLNRDGHPDLVVSNFCQEFNCYHGGVSVLLGNGNGTFQPAVSYGSGGPYGYSVAIADVNGDGYPDLVVADTCLSKLNCMTGSFVGEVGVLAGNGDGTFQPAVPVSTRGKYAESVAIGDVNGDGRPDLVVADSKSSTVAVLDNEFTVSPTVKVTSSPDPSLINQPVTFTATITANLPIPNGQTVTFYSGSTEIGTGATSNGVAALNASFPKAKTYKIKAKYSGGGFLKAGSGSVEQVVNP